MKSLLFNVQYNPWNAELQLPADATLATLARTIIKTVGFDMDHAYGFYDNLRQPYRSKVVYSLFADMGESDNEGDTGVQSTPIDAVFKPRKKMVFLFDYGDDWMFLVTCTGTKDDPTLKLPKVLSTSGAPPIQYPNWDEEE